MLSDKLHLKGVIYKKNYFSLKVFFSQIYVPVCFSESPQNYRFFYPYKNLFLRTHKIEQSAFYKIVLEFGPQSKLIFRCPGFAKSQILTQ